MTLTDAQLAANFGYFGPFMQAYGRADETLRAQVFLETVEYRQGQIDGPTEVRDVSDSLGIPAPSGY